MADVEFYFDCSSPWTYLAFSRIERLCAAAGATLHLKPVLVGGIFNEVNKEVYETRANPHPVKSRYYGKDLADWAAYCGVKIGMPPVFPVRAVKPQRLLLACPDQAAMAKLAWKLFEAYWGDLKDISQDDVLEQVVTQAGLDWPTLNARASDDDVKQALKDNTKAVMDRGGFGSPTIFVNGDDMYFGNDRLPLVAKALGLEGWA